MTEIQNIFDSFTCKICYQQYGQYRPQKIICKNNHIACEGCLKTILSGKKNNNIVNFSCPFCRVQSNSHYCKSFPKFTEIMKAAKIVAARQKQTNERILNLESQYKIVREESTLKVNQINSLKQQLQKRNQQLLTQEKKIEFLIDENEGMTKEIYRLQEIIAQQKYRQLQANKQKEGLMVRNAVLNETTLTLKQVISDLFTKSFNKSNQQHKQESILTQQKGENYAQILSSLMSEILKKSQEVNESKYSLAREIDRLNEVNASLSLKCQENVDQYEELLMKNKQLKERNNASLKQLDALQQKQLSIKKGFNIRKYRLSQKQETSSIINLKQQHVTIKPYRLRAVSSKRRNND